MRAARYTRLTSASLLITLLALTASSFAAQHMSGLDELVMLCATEAGSPRFDATWVAWVQANPEEDVEEVVADVVSRAGTLRSMAAPGLQPVRPARRPDRAAVADHMLRLARSTLAGLRREQESPAPG